MRPSLDPAKLARRLRIAWIVAIVADALQLVAFPFFVEGWISPVNDALDVVTSIVLFRLLGWHPALLPTLVAELLPGVDLVPTWTAAVGIVAWTRRGQVPPAAPAPSGATVVGDAPAPERGPEPPAPLPPAR